VSGRDLEKAVKDPGFTPAVGEIDGVVALLVAEDEKTADGAERALARTGLAGLRRAWDTMAAASPALRARVHRLAARVGEKLQDPAIEAALRAGLDDPEARARRAAISSLAKVAGARAEDAILARLTALLAMQGRVGKDAKDVPDGAEVRACLAALGKIGGVASREAIARVPGEDRETKRLREEALLKIDRTTVRTVDSVIDGSAPAPAGLRVWLRCRAGIEEILAEECAEILPDLRARAATAGLVEGDMTGSLDQLLLLRTAIRVGFPLKFVRGAAGVEAAEKALIEAMSSELAFSIFRTWTRGPLRYRIDWAQAGHRRASTFRAAKAIAAKRPELANDPTGSPWEVVIREHGGGIDIELWPRALPDHRFDWRTGDVPAASHPTLAAALARVAGVRPDDVVWDPFVGSGSELVERARRGRYARLFGTDLDPRAIAVARENLRAAGIEGATLAQLDARTFEPPARPTLILTNPPMGRRLSSFEEVEQLYAEVLLRAARLLTDDGRFVWISPVPDKTATLAASMGLRETLRQRVDMGGFPAAIQRFERERKAVSPQGPQGQFGQHGQHAQHPGRDDHPSRPTRSRS
jgi:23S rRNA G2445 N2-methylase RlmL